MLARRQLLDSLFDDWFRPLAVVGGQPSTDISSDKERVSIEMELPGVDPKNVDISVDNNVLTIKGEKIHESEMKGKEYLRTERYQGSFSRSFTLPSYVDLSMITADYNKGVLLVTVPKKQSVVPKQIKIKIKD